MIYASISARFLHLGIVFGTFGLISTYKNPTTLPDGRAVEYVRLTRTRYILFAHTGERENLTKLASNATGDRIADAYSWGRTSGHYDGTHCYLRHFYARYFICLFHNIFPFFINSLID